MMFRGSLRGSTTSAILAAFCITAHAASGADSELTTIRSGNHPGFGRIVVDLGGAATYKLEQTGEHVVVRFADTIKFDKAPAPPRNVVNLASTGATAEFSVLPGSVVHPAVISNHIVFDIIDPPAATASQVVPTASRKIADKSPKPVHPATADQAMTRSPELGGRTRPQPAPVTIPPDAVPVTTSEPHPAVAAIQQAVVVPPPAAAAPNEASIGRAPEAQQPASPGRDVLPESAGPVGLSARIVKLPKGLTGTAFVVPFGNATGAAVFQRSGGTFVVFDERRPVDMAALQGDPVFGRAAVQLLPSGTLLRLPVPVGFSIALFQTPQGWRIAALSGPAKSQPIVATYADGGMSLAAEQSSDVITMADPDTGATILVGTQRRPGQGVATTRRTTEFVLRTTALGVVVEPLSDSITLKVVPTGFMLKGKPDGLAASPSTAATDALMEAAHLTRRFNFATMPADSLMRLMTKQIADAAVAPPQARGPKRRAVAQSMLALGLAAEAESLLNVAAVQDPRLAASADTTGLTAIAALLAGRMDDAGGINDPRLTGSDDVALWRAVRQAMQDEGSPSAAAVFASTAPLAFLYPPPIRDRVVPLMIETMIQGGELAPAARLLAQSKGDSRLDYARALQMQAEGNTDQALGLLDTLAAGHDRFDRARAASRAVELRLASRKIDASQAADALDKLLYVWRGDQRELLLRERIAELRGQGGAWRVALATLRQAEADFPEQAAAVHARLRSAFAGMVAGRGLEQMTPIDVVSAIDENADLMPASGGDPVLEEQLADRLLALELPARAKPVLQKLMTSSTSAGGKARFGATLAALLSREKDDAGALAALDASETEGLPAELTEKRALLRASAMAHGGDPTAAAAILAAIATPAANQARAVILEQAQDWAGAERAWAGYAATAVPAAGALNDDQARTLLRLATAAARAGDDSALATLRERYDSRLSAGAFGDMFHLLTAEPVRGAGDLKRAKQEVSLAQSLPANLKALDGTLPSR